MTDLRQPFITMKNNRLLNLDEAWTNASGDDDHSDLKKIYGKVSYLFRGVDILSNAVSRMPFEIYRGDTVVDDSRNYQNVIGFMKHPGFIFGILEAAFQIWGYAYLKKDGSKLSLDNLRYLLPTTISYKIKPDGEITFTRQVNGQRIPLTTDELAYFWLPDPYVELGTPTSSSAQAAAAAGGVLLNVDEFASAFFERGAIKAQLFSVAGNIVPEERSKFKSFLRRLFRGSSSSWASDVLNADAVTVTEIGEGLESLDNRNLTDEQREAISTALGVPHSILFSNASNFAVADKDDFHFYDKKIVPDCTFIQEVLNEQVLEPQGYRLKFNWESLDVFQEDEKERSAAVQFYAQSFANYGEFAEPAMMLLGVDIPPEAQAMLDRLWAEQKAEKEQQRTDFLARLEQSRQAQPKDKDEPAELKPSPKEVEKTAAEIDLEKWERYALKRVKLGKVPDKEFESEHLDGAVKGAIYAALQQVETIDEVAAVFGDVWVGYP